MPGLQGGSTDFYGYPAEGTFGDLLNQPFSQSQPSGGVDLPQDTTSDPTTGPSAGSDPGSSDQTQNVINRLGFDPGNPRNDLTTGFGSGRPTDRIINGIATFLGNAAFPGAGRLTGPAAQGIYDMISHGASRRAVQDAVAQATGQGGGGGTGGTSGTGGDSGGMGHFRMPDFGNTFSGLPEGFTQSNRFGGGAPTFTAPGSVGPQFEHGSIFGQMPGDRSGPLPGSFAGLGSFSGASPLSGSWGSINSPIGRAAMRGVQFDPAKMPNPGFAIKGAVGPGNAPIVNWAAFGQGVSPGQSAHFNPRSVQ